MLPVIDDDADAVPSVDAEAALEALGDRVPKVFDGSGDDDLVTNAEADSVEVVEVDADRRAEALRETLPDEDFETTEERDGVFEMTAVTEGELVMVGVVLVDIDIDDDGVIDALAEAELMSDCETLGLDDELPLSTDETEASGDPEVDAVGDLDETKELD